jgi:hypothetical protein
MASNANALPPLLCPVAPGLKRAPPRLHPPFSSFSSTTRASLAHTAPRPLLSLENPQKLLHFLLGQVVPHLPVPSSSCRTSSLPSPATGLRHRLRTSMSHCLSPLSPSIACPGEPLPTPPCPTPPLGPSCSGGKPCRWPVATTLPMSAPPCHCTREPHARLARAPRRLSVGRFPDWAGSTGQSRGPKADPYYAAGIFFFFFIKISRNYDKF